MASAGKSDISICDGDYVVIKMDSVLRLINLKPRKPFFIHKRKANIYSAIGSKYGSFFEIQPDGELLRVSSPEISLDRVSSQVKDNRLLWDEGRSQKLTTDDIESFKARGVSGKDMVQMIVDNSATFEEKTAFAKEKYLRKKQKKYVSCFQILRPNLRLVAEMLFAQGPTKICNLRIDSLSQILSFANILSCGTYLVLESVSGLLVAGVLQMLGPSGRLIQLHLGQYSVNESQQQVIRALGLPDHGTELLNADFKSVCKKLACSDVTHRSQRNSDTSPEPSASERCERRTQEESEVSLKDGNLKTENSDLVDAINLNNSVDTGGETSKPAGKTTKRYQFEAVCRILAERSVDGLLIAVKNHPEGLLPLLDVLAPSRPFAIFSMYTNPLVDCYKSLKERRNVIRMNLTETWFRKYQVLAERTHPDYSMAGTGGYLLTGIKVDPPPVK